MAPSAALVPWTSGVTVAWRPDFAFYEQRIQILRDLRDQRLLRQFSAGEQEIRGRLSQGRDLQVSATGLRLTDTTASIYADASAFRALEIAVGRVDPVWGQIDLLATYLIPIEGDYNEIRSTTGTNLLKDPELRVTDYALLVDGIGEEEGLIYQLEFGIVSSAEAPDRVLRLVGRTGGSELHPSPPMLDRPYPEVALFVDCRWTAQGRGSDGRSLIERMNDLMARVPALNEELVRRVHAQLVGNNMHTANG